MAQYLEFEVVNSSQPSEEGKFVIDKDDIKFAYAVDNTTYRLVMNDTFGTSGTNVNLSLDTTVDGSGTAPTISNKTLNDRWARLMTANPGGVLTATITGHSGSTATWLCYSSGTSAQCSAPACGAAASATTVTASGSGTAVACTASATNGAAVSLTWTEATQTNIQLVKI